MARSKKTNDQRMAGRVSPRGHIMVDLYNGTYRLRLGTFSELADADEFLGRSLMAAISQDPTNFHLIRVAFYFGMRRSNKELRLRSIREAGELLEGTSIEYLGKCIKDALEAGGLPIDEDLDIDDDQTPGGMTDHDTSGEA